MTNGEIHDMSRVLGELTGEVKNLVRSQEALWKRMDDTGKLVIEQSGVMKMCVDKLTTLDAEQKVSAKKIGEHEALKNKVIGWGIGAGGITGAVASWLSKFMPGTAAP